MTDFLKPISWYFLAIFIGVAALTLPQPVAAQDEEVAGSGDENTEINPRSAPEAYPVDPFVMTVFRRGKSEGQLLIVVKLELSRTISILDIETSLPLLRNQMNAAARRFANERVRLERPVSPSAVAWYMQKAVDQVLGEGKARILVDEAVYRAL